MTRTARYAAKDELSRILAALARDRRVLAPQRQGANVLLRPLAPGEKPLLTRPTLPPKAVVFPQSEQLFAFFREKDPQESERANIRLDAAHEAEPTLVFGCRPCDARGLTVFDRVYLNGPYRDPYYAARREATVLASLACSKSCATCFCHWTGSGPADKTGSDLLFTDLGHGFVIEAATEHGAKMLTGLGLEEAGTHLKETVAQHEAALQRMGPAPDLSAARTRLEERFDDLDFWGKVSDKCLSCGACTYLCPACYCFNITDENDPGGLSGRRLRSWDNCMSPRFTLEASGHNPRRDKAQRLRNRVGHKFSIYPALHGGVFSCTGCGRCITGCPVSLDIRDVLLRALAADAAQKPRKEDNNV